ncbi:MAG: hypothetical protein JNL50_00730 [Phycisphaerae bacterium]|nr:hypothetical protein [Phycisphaerae bacterium]
MSISRRLIFSLALGVLTLGIVCFALPLAAIRAWGTRWNIGHWAADLSARAPILWFDASSEWAADGLISTFLTHPLIDRFDVQSWGDWAVPDRPPFPSGRPPAWAAAVPDQSPGMYNQVITTATGWPFHAFRGEQWIVLGLSHEQSELLASKPLDQLSEAEQLQLKQKRTERSQWTIRHAVTGDWAIPFAPMWAGLLADWVLFSVLWLLVLSLGRSNRDCRRRRRGLCTRCAYDLKGLAPASPCPECGHTPAHVPSLDHLTT